VWQVLLLDLVVKLGNVIQGIVFMPMSEIISAEFYEEVWIL